MEKRGRNKVYRKAIFFSTDALIALTIILLTVLVIYPVIKHRHYQSEMQGDIIKVLSSLKIGEINNSDVQILISEGKITDLNKSVLEQIGDFYVTDRDTAKQLANSILSTIDIKENVGIWYGNVLLASRNSTPFEKAKNVGVERQFISGISGDDPGETTTGFSARAYLTSSLQKKYFYFGGYVGDGNISVNIKYNGTLKNIGLEVAANTNFSICINNNPLPGCCPSAWLEPADSQFKPKNFSLSAYASCFNSGNNTIKFKPANDKDNLYFAGGFIKITYEDSAKYEPQEKYYFQGIEGLINIYDGFYVPGNLNEMEVSLRYNSNYTMFLTIGNVTVFNNRYDGEITETINDTILRNKLDYNFLSQKTVPLRLGLENVSHITSILKQADVFSVTDLSGSMSGAKLTNAKNATKILIDELLNLSGNRVGLVGYDTFAKIADYHELSNNKASLNNIVDNIWNAGDYTCICCGILRAINCFDKKIFEDNFNDQAIGTNPIGWSITESGGFIDITSNSLEGNRAVVISRTGSNNPAMLHRFPAQQDNLSIEFLVNHTSGSGRMRLEIEDTDGIGAYRDYIIIKIYNGQIRNNDAPITPYNLNTVYKIRVQLIPGSSTYNLYVNDILIGSNFPVYTTRSNVARITFTTENSAIRYITDNVRIFLNKDICTDTGTGNKIRSAIVMSDGQANKDCGLDPVLDYDADSDITDDPQDHTIEAACRAYNDYNITVHAVGFGSRADQTTLQRIAHCGNGSYYFSNVGNLVEIYKQIAQEIINASYTEQTIKVTGNISSKLYPDSYIKFGYTKSAMPYGLITTTEKKFNDNYSGSFSVPSGASVLETKVVSYSGARWTDNVQINGNSVYKLSDYGQDYTKLGDPYSINLLSLFVSANNIVNVTTGVSPTNSTQGSEHNKIIYTIKQNASAYSPVEKFAKGCNWTIEFEDSSINLKVPEDYSGTYNCYFSASQSNCGTSDGQKDCGESDDAVQIAVYKLLRLLDLNSDNKVDVKFTKQDLQIDFSEISGIPFAWSTEVQVRKWD